MGEGLPLGKRGEMPASQCQSEVSVSDKQRLKVFARVRPRSSKEVAQGEGGAIEVNSQESHLDVAVAWAQEVKRFRYDGVLREDEGQEEVFNRVASPHVHELLRGRSSLLFCYGVTNAGKTYTVHGTREDPGLLPTAIERVVDAVEALGLGGKAGSVGAAIAGGSAAAAAAGEEGPTEEERLQKVRNALRCTDEVARGLMALPNSDQMEAHLSCMEIYNDAFSDLLTEDGGGAAGGNPAGGGPNSGGINITSSGLRGEVTRHISNAQEAKALIEQARGRAREGSTNMNNASSRGHSGFVLSITRPTETGQGSIISRFMILDLAGSERNARTGATGERFKEAKSINSSLTSLKSCIQILRQNQQSRTKNLVPYRNSKLTRLFQFYFEAWEGRASMIINASPCTSDVGETLHALSFGADALEIRMTPQQPPPPPTPPPTPSRPSALPAGRTTFTAPNRRLGRSSDECLKLRTSLSEQWRQALLASQMDQVNQIEIFQRNYAAVTQIRVDSLHHAYRSQIARLESALQERAQQHAMEEFEAKLEQESEKFTHQMRTAAAEVQAYKKRVRETAEKEKQKLNYVREQNTNLTNEVQSLERQLEDTLEQKRRLEEESEKKERELRRELERAKERPKAQQTPSRTRAGRGGGTAAKQGKREVIELTEEDGGDGPRFSEEPEHDGPMMPPPLTPSRAGPLSFPAPPRSTSSYLSSRASPTYRAPTKSTTMRERGGYDRDGPPGMASPMGRRMTTPRSPPPSTPKRRRLLPSFDSTTTA